MCIDGSVYMTKTAATPIYGKNLLCRTGRHMTLKLRKEHWGLKLYKVCIKMGPKWPVGRNNYINGPGYMTKVNGTPSLYLKTFKNSSLVQEVW